MENVLKQVQQSMELDIGEVWTWDTPGICEQAKTWAEDKRIAVTVFDAEHGPAKRNRVMLSAIPVDHEEKLAILVAFVGGAATNMMVESAEEAGIGVLEVDY